LGGVLIDTEMKNKYRNGFCKGYVWRYYEENYPLKIDTSEIKRIYPEFRIYKYDLDMNFIEEFVNVKEAAKSVGKTNLSEIRRVAIGKAKRAYGFIWKYEKIIK